MRGSQADAARSGAASPGRIGRKSNVERVEEPLEQVQTPRRTLRLTTIGLSLLATAILFGLVAFQAVIVSSQSTIDDLDREIEAASRMNQKLRLDVAELEAPERIRLIARSNLGMIEPEVVDYLEPISIEELAPTGDEGR